MSASPVPSHAPLPLSLKLVAALFFLIGLASAADVIGSLMYGRVSLNLGVLGLFIAVGLLKLKPEWRIAALLILWISLFAMSAGAALLLIFDEPRPMYFLGQEAGSVSRWVLVEMTALGVVLVLWQYWTLVRPRIAGLFGVKNPRTSLHIIALGLAIGLIGGGLAWVQRAAVNDQLPFYFPVPEFARREALEDAYASQFAHLEGLASDLERRRRFTTNDPENERLFSMAEILEAKVEVGQNSWFHVTPDRHENRSSWGLHTKPDIGRSVVNRVRATDQNGVQRDIILYHRRLIDARGQEAGFQVTFDMQALRAAVERRDR